MENSNKDRIINICKNSTIYTNIIKPASIYNAIYSLDSYIFEPYLLEQEDIETFYKLKDKYNDQFINEYIDKCIKRINDIILNDKLFNCTVFFKAKKVNDKKTLIVFRPIHSASLLDQICMVVFLSAIMFDDSSGKRKLSAISRLLPANFYGNIPSTNVSEIFKYWGKQYKEYSNNSLDASKEYYENKRFKYELTLDIKNFFPSIDPTFIMNYILDKWPVNTELNDKKFIYIILEKLLFLKLELPKELNDKYCTSILNEQIKYNIGIPQGLPQAYYFGNICMSIVAKHENKLLEGDSYFYVDDSIIFTNKKIDADKIKNLEVNINNEILKYVNKKNSPEIHKINKKILLNNNYKLEIHPIGGKSQLKKIEKIDTLYNISKPASTLSFEIKTAQDEFEDLNLLKKATVLVETIDKMLEKIKDSKEEEISKDSKIKRLNMLRKFYLNRTNFLDPTQIKDFQYNNENEIDDFINSYDLKSEDPKTSKFFEKLGNDIFCFKIIIIAKQILNFDDLTEKFQNAILHFEKKCLGIENESLYKYLYFTRVVSTLSKLNIYFPNEYNGLNYNKGIRCITHLNRTTNITKIKNIKLILKSINDRYEF